MLKHMPEPFTMPEWMDPELQKKLLGPCWLKIIEAAEPYVKRMAPISQGENAPLARPLGPQSSVIWAFKCQLNSYRAFNLAPRQRGAITDLSHYMTNAKEVVVEPLRMFSASIRATLLAVEGDFAQLVVVATMLETPRGFFGDGDTREQLYHAMSHHKRYGYYPYYRPGEIPDYHYDLHAPFVSVPGSVQWDPKDPDKTL